MSLFGHLAVRFGSHPENLATEALGYVLKKSAAARRGFIASMRHEGIDLPFDLDFVNQASSDDQGRPDLAGTDHAGDLRVLVEAKFHAGLTEHQPVGYLGQLKDGGVLVVIAPEARLSHLWLELLHRLDGQAMQVKIQPGAVGHAIVGTKHLVLQSWGRALTSTKLELSGEPEILADISQVEGLCSRMDLESFLPMTSEELTSTIFRRVHEFGRIVDDVVATLAAEGTMNTKGARATGANGWYGRYARLQGAAVLLQVSTWKWTLLGPSPLWLTVYGATWQKGPPGIAKRQLAAFGLKHPGRLHEDRLGFPTILLRVPAGVERVKVIASVMDQLREIGEVIAPLGVGAKDDPVPDLVSDGGES